MVYMAELNRSHCQCCVLPTQLPIIPLLLFSGSGGVVLSPFDTIYTFVAWSSGCPRAESCDWGPGSQMTGISYGRVSRVPTCESHVVCRVVRTAHHRLDSTCWRHCSRLTAAGWLRLLTWEKPPWNPSPHLASWGWYACVRLLISSVHVQGKYLVVDDTWSSNPCPVS
jgi:hypothetical protein